MTMLSFRISDDEAADGQRWAERLGVDRSELLREALHRHLVRFRAEDDIEAWTILPLTADEAAFTEISDWGLQLRTGRIGPMEGGEVWFAATPGGDGPELISTRDPVADRIGTVVVAALASPAAYVSEFEPTPDTDGVPTERIVNFVHTLPRDSFRRRVTQLGPLRMAEVCRTLRDATSR